MILESRPCSKVLLTSGSDPNRSSSARELVWSIPDDDKLLSHGHLKLRLSMRGCQIIRTGNELLRLLMSCLKFKHYRKGRLSLDTLWCMWVKQTRSSITWKATSISAKYAVQPDTQQNVSFEYLKYEVALLHVPWNRTFWYSIDEHDIENPPPFGA
jgi:hypothetical protein